MGSETESPVKRTAVEWLEIRARNRIRDLCIDIEQIGKAAKSLQSRLDKLEDWQSLDCIDDLATLMAQATLDCGGAKALLLETGLRDGSLRMRFAKHEESAGSNSR
jgi:hypothetical protein